MTQRGPWSVKGIDSRARDVAREAAREEGVTLGAYLNRLILEEGPLDPGPQNKGAAYAQPAQEPPRSPIDPAPSATGANSLDRLTRRIESAEARSTLAITGIDQSVVGLLSRLENAEHNQQAIGNHFETMLDDIQKTYEALDVKVKTLEADDSAGANLTALKALEDALGKLASYVYEENALVGEEASAIKSRLESGLHEFAERMDSVDNTIQSKLDETVKEFRTSVSDAELRTEGISKHLAERFTSVEMEVADKLSHVQEMSSSMDQVHDTVEGVISDMGDTLGQMQERLSRAETKTDKAMQDLQAHFGALDTRLAEMQRYASAETEAKFEQQFENLTNDLRELVTNTRVELASEIEAAAKTVDIQALNRIDRAIDSIGSRLDASEAVQTQTMDMVGETVSRVTESVDQRLTANQAQQARAIEQVSQQVTRISEGFDSRMNTLETHSSKAETDALREEMIRFTNTLDDRLEYLETREDETFEKISSEVEKIADKVEQRVAESENRSAAAIGQIGEQVTGASKRMENRQQAALRAFAEKLTETQKRQDARLSSALNSVSNRLERIQEQSISSMSPVQKAIASLAQRMEAIEDFSSPPYTERGETPPVPTMVPPVKIDTDLSADALVEDSAEFGEMNGGSTSGSDISAAGTGFLDPIFEDDDEIDLAKGIEPRPGSQDAEFEPGFQSWADDANSILDDTLNTAGNAASDLNEDLIIHDGVDETRDDDIFAEAGPPPIDVDNLVNREFEARAETPARPHVQNEPKAPAGDYLSRARQAALNASGNDIGATYGAAPAKPASGNGGLSANSKALGVAAIAAAAVVGGVLYTRGNTQAPSLEFGKDTGPVETAATTDGEGPTGEDSNEAAFAAATIDADVDEAALEAELEAEFEADLASETDDLTETAATIPETADTAVEPDALSVETVAASASIDHEALLAARPIPKRVSLADAAQNGDRIAQYQLGVGEMQNGRFSSGANWFKKASEQGLAAAQHELAILHENGTGTNRDFTQARYWHNAAARGGNVNAMFDFATYNANGEGGEVNAQVAAKWFRNAAEFGHTDSQYNLALLYSQGSGVTPNYVESLYWFSLAAQGGDKDAGIAAQNIIEEGYVSAPEAQSVRQRVLEWKQATPNPDANGTFGPQSWNAGNSGNGGNRVLAVQRVLTALGYDVGTADGLVGGQTTTAIKAFERSAGMPETGQINDRLIDVLNATLKVEQETA